MAFADRKKGVLSRIDKSRKGAWDELIIPLCEAINAHPSWVTTSSCSGRVLITSVTARKHEAQWLLSSHDAVTVAALNTSLEHLPPYPVTFKVEPFIVHVECDGLASSSMLLRVCNQAGLRRCGIISAGERFVVEVQGVETLEVPIAESGKLVVGENYLAQLVSVANGKLEKNAQRIRRLTQNVLRSTR